MIPSKFASKIKKVLCDIEQFEASGSIPNTGTGSRSEGRKFEHLIQQLWQTVSDTAVAAGADVEIVKGQNRRYYHRLTVDYRSLLLPATEPALNSASRNNIKPHRWLEVHFQVSDLVSSFPTEDFAIRRFAPATGPYAYDNYPKIYDKLRTSFDDTIALVDNGTLLEKILLEYKTAKSSGGNRIDGNAHERLSFQILQYLEAATRYTRCSLVVIANGAFVRYKNKYHTNFHIQAERLKNFAWFNMKFMSTCDEYLALVDYLLGWLLIGQPIEWEKQVD